MSLNSFNSNKKNVVIPIFVSHQGCPNDCVFCNQRKIAMQERAFDELGIRTTIEEYIKSIKDKKNTDIDIAFYGGSFTGIDLKLQNKYLNIAEEYVKLGYIRGIRMSTRPDYINKEILDNLKNYTVVLIELGVQSFDETVLKLSERGHSVEDVYKAIKVLKEYGFDYGIQLMIGLPGDSKDISINSAIKASQLEPKTIRIYPTLIIKETKLEEMYYLGSYRPLSLENAVDVATEMYKIFIDRNINVIRIGLQATDNITTGEDVVAGPFHSAFRHLVESKIILEELESKIDALNVKGKILEIVTLNRNISEIVGINRSNIKYLEKKFEIKKIKFNIVSEINKKFDLNILDG